MRRLLAAAVTGSGPDDEERRQAPRTFWRDALAIRGSISRQVAPGVLGFGAFAVLTAAAVGAARASLGAALALEVSPHEIAGAVLALLLVLRTNAGHSRWWEARTLWGGIVNQSRNLAVGAVAYGPADPAWRAEVVAWTAAFAHVARASLRGEVPPPEVAALVGADAAGRLAAADHMPTAVALRLAELLRTALPRNVARDGERAGVDVPGRLHPFAFAQLDRERALLVDHVGGCERILKTPLPRVYAITVRRFLALFLATLPLALLGQLDRGWLVPLVTMAVAYPLLALDRIGEELQNPFATGNVNHLPLDALAAAVERNLRALVGPAATDGVQPTDRVPAGAEAPRSTTSGAPGPASLPRASRRAAGARPGRSTRPRRRPGARRPGRRPRAMPHVRGLAG